MTSFPLLAAMLDPFWPAAFFTLAAFVLVWMISEAVRNAGVVDIAWSSSFTALAVFYGFTATGNPFRRLVLIALVSFWSVRLARHIWERVKRTHPTEDERYSMAREMWQPGGDCKFLLFFQAQAVLALVLSVPFLLFAQNASGTIKPLEWTGMLVVVVSILGEALADRQLSEFKADPANAGLTCREGLWRYSRHPNYFFEFMIWVGFALLAISSPWGWTALYAPALMYYFLWYVTGIPLTEKRALESRGEDYRRYQETTSPFFPWFPKSPR